jgi:tetratricopeptide (TPR) repeat protein
VTGDRVGAERLTDEASALQAQGDALGAERAYLAALAADPDWSVPHYNLGLVRKYQLRWEESFALNARAAALAPEDEAANWNLGIAATALGRWADARRAWAACGIDVPPGDGPPDFPWGQTPVRLEPDTAGEVVWARRLDPARARIESVPLPTSPFRWGDVVLIDGAQEGERIVNGKRYPVFNVLQRLHASGSQTFIVELAAVTEAAIEHLEDVAEEAGGAAEHWGSATRILCRECSYGAPHAHDDEDAAPAHPHCGLAARSAAHAQEVIDRWLAAAPGVDVARWYPAPPAAD